MIINRLRRVTSSGTYYAEIDGLRFVAIASVVLFHLNFYFGDGESGSELGRRIQSAVSHLLTNGNRGVEIFFAISGLVLALPFASHYINRTQRPKLSKYYLRRLTRLEPPYIIALLLCFSLLAYRFAGDPEFPRYLKSFLASLVYTHNFFFPRDVLPLTNPVTWSLEIEVQFYILAPLLAVIFAAEPRIRRIALLLFIAGWPVVREHWVLPHASLLDAAQYFIAGFLVGDFFVSRELAPAEGRLRQNVYLVSGVLAFAAIWICRPVFLAPVILGMFICVFRSSALRTLASHPVISVTGGMCYSIYLIHWPLLTTLGGLIKAATDNFILRMLAGIALIAVASVLFFVLVERPFMGNPFRRQRKDSCGTLSHRTA